MASSKVFCFILESVHTINAFTFIWGQMPAKIKEAWCIIKQSTKKQNR